MRWLQGLDAAIHSALRAHSIAILRVVLGVVFLQFRPQGLFTVRTRGLT